MALNSESCDHNTVTEYGNTVHVWEDVKGFIQDTA